MITTYKFLAKKTENIKIMQKLQKKDNILTNSAAFLMCLPLFAKTDKSD